MALNLSTLTSSATSGDVLAEALTTADFLEGVPVLRNLARGSQKGGDAKQGTALNQPKALPLIKNPAGDLGGYLYIPNVSGNYATGPSVTIGSNQTWQAEVDMVVTQFGSYIAPMGGGYWANGFGVIFYSDGGVRPFSKGDSTLATASGVTLGTPFNLKYGFDGTNLYVDRDSTRVYTATAPSQSGSITHSLQLNQTTNLSQQGNYAIQKAKLTVNSAVVFDCDFNGSTSIRHGDTKFNCVGGPVVLNQSGNDPATVIKKSVLRFDGANDFMDGLLNQTVTGGYMFAAFSVLGNGGESYGHILDVTSTGAFEYEAGGFDLRRNTVDGSNLEFRYNGAQAATIHQDVMDDSLGDILLEHQFQNGAQVSKLNNANEANGTTSLSGVLSSEEFRISALKGATSRNGSLDLEFLALFPASITDAQADDVRNYINNRNNVFSLIDSQGYYFYNAQSAPVGAITTGSSSWNGRIVGSDLGDSDRYLTQGTTNDAPVGDGYVVTFADNTDHLDIPSTTQAGWQVVGTSLGTFAYRVNANAVTELNLLGNLGSTSYRQAGDLYGVILLPESATGKDIEEARKLLIDRGSLDGSLVSAYFANWVSRNDIVEFHSVDLSNATNVSSAWDNCSSLTTFPALNLSGATNISYSWVLCSSLNNFGAIDARNGTNFTGAWKDCSSLTSFPAGAKLGTSAQNVNFTSAWQSSGLTSFPADIDLSNGTVFSNAFRETDLISFPAINLQNGIEFVNTWYNCTSLSSFGNANLNGGKNFNSAWRFCTALEDFPPLFTNWNPTSLQSTVFNNAWDFCTSLTAQSVENILTSIDASGQHGTDDGTSTGSPLADAGIDIDYDGTTGSLSAATNSAVTSLKSKGWSIIVNNVTL